MISKQDVVVQKKSGEEAIDDTSQGTSKGVFISLLLILPLTSLLKDHFVFAAAMVPEEKETSLVKRSIKQLFPGSTLGKR